MTTPLKKSKIYELTIDAIAFGGNGKGMIDGFVVFVPKSCPGDHLKVRIVELKKRYAHAVIDTIVKPSPKRHTPPECRHFESCGGCHYMHLSYEDECDAKMSIIRETIERKKTLGVDMLQQIIPAKDTLAYRNKVTFHVKSVQKKSGFGFYDCESHFMPVEKCEIIDERIQLAFELCQKKLDSSDLSKYSDIIFRHGSDDTVYIYLKSKSDVTYHDVQNIQSKLTTNPIAMSIKVIRDADVQLVSERIKGMSYSVPIQSFAQVNPAMGDQLIDYLLLLPIFGKKYVVWDLFSGCGYFGLAVAEKVKYVVAIESDYTAAMQSQKNAEAMGVANFMSRPGNVDSVIKKMGKKQEKADIVILDPPRRGVSEALIDQLSEFEIPTIVYVSCNISTLVRDLDLFQKNGYRIESIQPVDLFPRTFHVENVALLKFNS